MGNGCMKDNDNVYFRARKQAATYNERLNSREGASELLGISASTLADYELGNTKVIPVDKVVLMADLYNSPELKTAYCKCECPIGRKMPIATTVNGLEGIALRLIKSLDADSTKEMKSKIIEIAADGIISECEKSELESVIKKLDALAHAISELKLLGEKALKGQ